MRGLAVALAVVAVSACEGPAEPNIEPVRVSTLDGWSNSGTTGYINMVQGLWVFQLKDQAGNPVVGETVLVTVSEGSVEVPRLTTDTAGYAYTLWRLGARVGTQTLTARAGSRTFTAVVPAGPPPVADVWMSDLTEITPLSQEHVWFQFWVGTSHPQGLWPELSYYVSRDQHLSSDDVRPSGLPISMLVQSAGRPLGFGIPRNLVSPGWYHIIAVADAPGHIQDSNRSNNTVVTAVPVRFD